MGKFQLMALPYAPEALEPVISRETIGFHHGKHLAAYVNNLNALLPGSDHLVSLWLIIDWNVIEQRYV
jgi:Fe-Mn family superoxide dismutase